MGYAQQRRGWADAGRDDTGPRPVCLHCLMPFDPFDHYCRHCGEAVGRLTPYIPYVNIRFNYGIFGRLWKAVWGRRSGASLPARAFYLLLIILCAPVMFLGVPLLLAEPKEDGGGAE